MPPEPTPISASSIDLLAHRDWMRRLAFRLVHDDATADDLVQDTWRIALERPPTRDGVASWLRRVLSRRAARHHRERARTTRRLQRVALPDDPIEPPDQLLQGELEARVANAVERLAEPYRTTVIRVFYEEQRPAEIAAEHGIPESTVRTQLSRAIAQLRRDLDRDYGSGWQMWIVPALATSASRGSRGGASAAGGLAFEWLRRGAPLLVAALAGAGIATAVHEAIDRPVDPAASPPPIVDGATETQNETSSTAEVDALRARLAAATAVRRRLESENAALRASASSSENGAEERKAPPAPSIPARRYGKWSDADWLDSIDLGKLAVAVRTIEHEMRAILAAERAGRPSDPASHQRIFQAYHTVQDVDYQLLGKVTTTAGFMGEITHPLLQGNLIAALLELEGLPLEEQQWSRIAAAGEEHDATATARRQKELTDGTLYLERMREELAAKLRFLDEVEAVLDERQRAVAFPPEIDGWSFDVRSPIRMIRSKTTTIEVTSRDQFRKAIVEHTAEWLQVETKSLAALPLFDAWVAAVEPLFTRYARPMYADDYRLERAWVAIDAQVDALNALVALPEFEGARDPLDLRAEFLIPIYVGEESDDD